MPPQYLAYGEGQFATTATGIVSGLLALAILLVLFGVYASKTYPNDLQSQLTIKSDQHKTN
jgi:hypothetical protein